MMYMHAYIGFLLSHLNDENHGFTFSKRINRGMQKEPNTTIACKSDFKNLHALLQSAKKFFPCCLDPF